MRTRARVSARAICVSFRYINTHMIKEPGSVISTTNLYNNTDRKISRSLYQKKRIYVVYVRQLPEMTVLL